MSHPIGGERLRYAPAESRLVHANGSWSGVVVRSTGAYGKLSGHPARPVLGWVARVECLVPSHYTCQAVQSGFRESFSWLSIILQKRRKIEVPPTFLSDRKMRVAVDGVYSPWARVTCGVTQGTVLGPLLFLIYINDLLDCVTEGTVVHLFADDCLVYRVIHSHDDQVILNKDLTSLQKWSEMWGMSFNPCKCNILQVSHGDPSSHFYQLCGEVLQKVSDAKYLGILISSDLSWDKHISDVARRANYTLGLIRRNLLHCARDAKTTAYFSLVRSTTNYCSAIWDPYLEKDKTKLERVNRRAARIICNKTDPRDHTSVTNLLRKDLGWPTLEHWRRQLRLTLMYRICHQQIAVPPTQLLPPNRPTRSNHQYKYQNHSDPYWSI